MTSVTSTFIIKANDYHDLVSEVLPDDDPYLDRDTVFGVPEDLIMHYGSQPAGSFPSGLALSENVQGQYSKAGFDFKRKPNS